MFRFDKYKNLNKRYKRNIKKIEDDGDINTCCRALIASQAIVLVSLTNTLFCIFDGYYPIASILAISTSPILFDIFIFYKLLFSDKMKKLTDNGKVIYEIGITVTVLSIVLNFVTCAVLFDKILVAIAEDAVVAIVTVFCGYILIHLFASKSEKRAEKNRSICDMLYASKCKLEFFDDVEQLKEELSQLLTIARKLINKEYNYDEQSLKAITLLLESDKVYYQTLYDFVCDKNICDERKNQLLNEEGLELKEAIHKSCNEMNSFIKQLEENKHISDELHLISKLKLIPKRN